MYQKAQTLTFKYLNKLLKKMNKHVIKKNMVDIKSILKLATDKIKEVVEKKDIPLADAFAQMDADIEEAEKAYGEKFFPDDGEPISPDDFYLKQLGFKSGRPSFEDIKARYEMLVLKFNPANFEGDEEKQVKAAKKIESINNAYNYFETQNSEKNKSESE